MPCSGALLPLGVPHVLVQGTEDDQIPPQLPARWAEMANELLGDPNIASHYQLWFFIYNSGNPIVLSSMRLRESLKTPLFNGALECRLFKFDLIAGSVRQRPAVSGDTPA